jgi:hypothetical protein
MCVASNAGVPQAKPFAGRVRRCSAAQIASGQPSVTHPSTPPRERGPRLPVLISRLAQVADVLAGLSGLRLLWLINDLGGLLSMALVVGAWHWFC